VKRLPFAILLLALIVSGDSIPPGDLLSISITNATDVITIDWWNVQPATTDPSGSSGSVPVICYSGPAYLLTCQSLFTSLVEHSSNLIDWHPFPATNFQLTFFPGSNYFLIPCELGPRFFRLHSQ